MDELDRKILRLLSADGRMTVKDIARQVSLTSPAVSERIRRMEKTGVIVTPGSAFGREGEGYVRFALVISEEKIREMLEVLRQSGMFEE